MLQEKYQKELKPKLQKDLGIKNLMAVPAMKRVVINMGVKDAVSDKKNIERAVQVMTQIAGQKPKVTAAKKSISTFKLREGDKIGVMVTLRGKRMYTFIEKLIAIVLPRLRDFRGIKRTSFDGQGNYTLGLTEFTVFPEIDPGKVDRVQGLEICFVTSAQSKKEGEALLSAFGMPFEKQ